MKFNELAASIPEEMSAIIRRTSRPEAEKQIAKTEGGLFLLGSPKSGYERQRLPWEWKEQAIDDFELVKFAPVPQEGIQKQDALLKSGWTPELIAQFLGEPHGVHQRGRGFNVVQTPYWAKDHVQTIAKLPEVAVALKAQRQQAKAEKGLKASEQARAEAEAAERLKQAHAESWEQVQILLGERQWVKVIANPADKTLTVSYPYNETAVELIKTLNGRYSGAPERNWVIPVGAQGERIVQVIEQIRGLFGQQIAAGLELQAFAERVFPLLAEEFACPQLQLSREGMKLLVRFPKIEAAILAIKSVKGRVWDNDRRAWIVSFAQIDAIRGALSKIVCAIQTERQALAEKLARQEAEMAEKAAQRKAAGIHSDDIWTASRHAPLEVGQITRRRRRTLEGGYEIIVITHVNDPRYCSEPLSFGSPDEDLRWQVRYDYRLATDEEAAPLRAKEVAEKTLRQARKDLDALHAELRQTGEALWGPEHTSLVLTGERIDLPHRPQDIYGGGDWFVKTDTHIWAVRNNGHDGDFWGINNIQTGGAGAVGAAGPLDEALWARIQKLASDATEKAACYLEVEA